MSFRRRLTLFFVVIVLLPMLTLGALGFYELAASADRTTQAQLEAGRRAAGAVFDDARARARGSSVAVANDPTFARALREGDLLAATRRARRLLGQRGLARIVLVRGGRIVLSVGWPTATAVSRSELVSRSGQRFGELQVSAQDAADYVALLRRSLGEDVHVDARRERILATSLPATRGVPLPRGPDGDVELGGRWYRTTRFEEPGFGGRRVQVTLLVQQSAVSGDLTQRLALAGAVLLGFFVLAMTFALTVSRALREEIRALLEGARRLGAGDLSARVRTEGGDEFAALGAEFNNMAAQLEARVEELGRERARVERSVRRLGQALASNLYREALLEIVVHTALESVGATAGRAVVRPARSGPPAEHARVGEVHALEDVMRAVEDEALVSREPRSLAIGGVSAMAHPLREDDGHGRVVGVVSVGRRGRRFTPGEEDLFNELAAQAGVSMKNVELHETRTRESLTDQLTGLSNRRRFDEALVTQAERARRFGRPLGLVLLDIDDFKHVNDTHGHQQGDVVLREVARVLRETCREIDEPARYGGEELVVVLPETDVEGAHELAERVRREVGELRLPIAGGELVEITVSCGVAALPESAEDEHDLVAAADAALYEAKRSGKDRSVRAVGQLAERAGA